MSSPLQLSGKTALVTGASSGLGAHFAATLAQAGATVILAARRQDALAKVAAVPSGRGGACRVLQLDVTSAASIAVIEPELSDLDILVKNAGVVRDGAARDQT